MTDLIETEKLAPMIERAATTLAKATTAAEVLDAFDHATVAYDAAKLASRLERTRDARDEVLAACRKVMGDALKIAAQAQCRIADEYDAAQERGEVATRADGTSIRDHVPGENKVKTVTDIGLTRKTVHEARIIRDAEKTKPGIVNQTIDAKLAAGAMPLRVDVKRAAETALMPKATTPPYPESHPAPAPSHAKNTDGWSPENRLSPVKWPFGIFLRNRERAEFLEDMLHQYLIDRCGWDDDKEDYGEHAEEDEDDVMMASGLLGALHGLIGIADEAEEN
jgi:hypothetical protein